MKISLKVMYGYDEDTGYTAFWFPEILNGTQARNAEEEVLMPVDCMSSLLNVQDKDSQCQVSYEEKSDRIHIYGTPEDLAPLFKQLLAVVDSRKKLTQG